jgi:tetratricopeptide (TPR) repeat protein
MQPLAVLSLLAVFGGQEPALRSMAERLQAADSTDEIRAVAVQVGELRAGYETGTDRWLRASHLLAITHHHIWEPEALIEIDGEVLTALALGGRAEQARGQTEATLSGADRGRVAQIDHWGALALQARGRHEEAASILTEQIRALPNLQGLEFALRWIDLARSLEALDRQEDAVAVLREARAVHGGLAIACLEASYLASLAGEGYAGRYRDDPLLVDMLSKAVRELPSMRRRTLERLDLPDDLLDDLVLTTADRPKDLGGALAFTFHDLRRSDLQPRIVVFAEALVRGEHDVQQILRHELTHAAAHVTLGTFHERLPGWIIEGLAYSTADEVESCVTSLLMECYSHRPDEFVFDEQGTRTWFKRRYGPAAPGAEAQPSLILPFLLLKDHLGSQVGAKLLATLARLGDLDAALEALVGMDSAEYLEAAQEHALQRVMQERRRVLLSFVAHHSASQLDPAAALEVIDMGLAKTETPIGRTFLRFLRGKALGGLGRFDEAAEEFSAIVEAPPPRHYLLQESRLFLGRALVQLGDPEAGRALFLSVSRYARNPALRGLARDLLAK